MLMRPTDRMYRDPESGEVRIYHKDFTDHVPDGWVELVPAPAEGSRTESGDASRDAAIDVHLMRAASALRRSEEVDMVDGHAQLCATQALVEAAVALVAAVRPTPTMTGEVTREGDDA